MHSLSEQDGKTALHLASEHGRVKVVQVLIKYQVDINLQDKVLKFNFALTWMFVDHVLTTCMGNCYLCP